MTKPPFSLPDLSPDAFGAAMTEAWKSLGALSVPPTQLAEVQADPDETAMPLIPMISDSPSTKLKDMLTLCGTRALRSPFA